MQNLCGRLDALAPSFGTAHGIYKARPVLDLERVWIISEKTGFPLVMHGGSGVSQEDYRTGIANGLRKINYYSYMSKAGTSAVRELLNQEDVTFFHDLALTAQKAMEADAEKAMRVFAVFSDSGFTRLCQHRGTSPMGNRFFRSMNYSFMQAAFSLCRMSEKAIRQMMTDKREPVAVASPMGNRVVGNSFEVR